MADTAITDLTSLASADVADTDVLPIADLTAGATKKITPIALAAALNDRGLVAIEFGEPSDGSIPAGSGIAWVNQSVSPWTMNIKTKDTSSPEVVTNFVIG